MEIKIKYFVVAVLIFCLELLILQTDGFIRFVLGDFFVVILLYYLLRSLTSLKSSTAAISVLIFAFLVELVQLTPLSSTTLFQEYPILRILLGTTFQWEDLIAYSLGILTAYALDNSRFLSKKSGKHEAHKVNLR